ncbi:hypothetical protein [Caballeronia sp. LZ032]|uniref:hypothetical protein n=1 Tax=Caballeronia sp. LZ032 TaxID=3038565 RepID=UPI002862E4C1|nr:hypothetical protein [Caballeronia sp. LZ032]MDR5878809.1 hypothetical protein [Caballeronia sp. LZ032]
MARYVLVRDVVARIVAESNCTEAEAALALSALLSDTSNRALNCFDIQEVRAGLPTVAFNASKLTFMLLQLQEPDPEYDPRLSLDEIWDVWGGGESGKKDLLREHCGVQFHYSFACFLCDEIEPMLRNAGLLAKSVASQVKLLVTAPKPRGKLTDEQVQEIIRLSKKGEKPRALAANFGVTRQAIEKILAKADALQPAWPPGLATKY